MLFQLKTCSSCLIPAISFQSINRRTKLAIFFIILFHIFFVLLTFVTQSIFNISLKSVSEKSPSFWNEFVNSIGLFETISSNWFLMFICFLISEVRLRFATLNGILRTEKQVWKELSWIFMQLCDAVEILNAIFAMPIMLYICSLLIATTFHLYDLYALLKSPQMNAHQIGYSMAANMYSFLILLQMFLFLSCCSLTLKEARKSMEILQRKLQREHFKIHSRKCEKSKKLMKNFILQLKHIQPKFSCGFYDFNWITIQTVSKLLNILI